MASAWKRRGMKQSLAAALVLAGALAVAVGEEREEREGHEGHEGRGHKTSARSIYKEVPPAVSRRVSYEKDVRPILLENCTRCHGARKSKGHLRLDTPEGILKGSEDEPVIKPGRGAESLLVRAMAGVGVEAEEVMPPKDDLLSVEEIGIIRAWIDQGAKFK